MLADTSVTALGSASVTGFLFTSGKKEKTSADNLSKQIVCVVPSKTHSAEDLSLKPSAKEHRPIFQRSRSESPSRPSSNERTLPITRAKSPANEPLKPEAVGGTPSEYNYEMSIKEGDLTPESRDRALDLVKKIKQNEQLGSCPSGEEQIVTLFSFLKECQQKLPCNKAIKESISYLRSVKKDIEIALALREAEAIRLKAKENIKELEGAQTREKFSSILKVFKIHSASVDVKMSAPFVANALLYNCMMGIKEARLPYQFRDIALNLVEEIKQHEPFWIFDSREEIKILLDLLKNYAENFPDDKKIKESISYLSSFSAPPLLFPAPSPSLTPSIMPQTRENSPIGSSTLADDLSFVASQGLRNSSFNING